MQTDNDFGSISDEQAKYHAAGGNDVYYFVYSYISNNTLWEEWRGEMIKQAFNKI